MAAHLVAAHQPALIVDDGVAAVEAHLVRVRVRARVGVRVRMIRVRVGVRKGAGVGVGLLSAARRSSRW